jgi:putative flippase GtrA
VGVAATATDFLIFNLSVTSAGDPAWERILAASTIAFGCGTVVGYLLNSRFTFGRCLELALYARYVCVALGGVAIHDVSLLALLTLSNADSILTLNLIRMAAVATSAVWNFCGFAIFVFRAQSTPVASLTTNAGPLSGELPLAFPPSPPEA